MKNNGGGQSAHIGADAILTFNEDFTDRSKVARSDNPYAYKQFAKMNIPKHVENFIADEEEFGYDSATKATAKTI